ncbi:head GIN domain-containing protein [Archangium sp.]|uniref:head GIN domain-containing protein n=1 Tax=Archangium sp. TaxID=1872627 RepID=UPI002D36BDAB|nr:head GIN domain-containing protein [Archangium sp.]HYO54929.1 head GIN domain-containing protein [Archangium sp.]
MKIGSRRLWVVMSLVVMAFTGCGVGPNVQGSGRVVREERQTPDFVALKVNDGIEASVRVDPSQPRTVHLVGDDNLVALVRAEKVGSDTLHVHLRADEVGSWSSSNPLRVEVTVPDLEALTRSDGSTVEVSGNIAPASFSLTASGGGRVKVSGLATESLSMQVSGGGEVTLEGSATRVTSTMSGGSELKARDFSAQDATLSSSGGGATVMRVSGSLRVTASGGGVVHIVGQPSVRSRALSGGSTLTFE